MNVNCDQPDLLLAYTPGNAGRFLTHLAMLSPDVHTWSAQVESELDDIPMSDHATYKLAFIVDQVFPTALKTDISNWKQYEPQPWGLEFPKTKKFIRHAWMMAGVQDVGRFGNCSIAYTDYSHNPYFSVRAVISKHTYGITRPRTDLPPGQWYNASDVVATRALLVEEFGRLADIIAEWKATSFFAIDIDAVVSDNQLAFEDMYMRLCKHYSIVPVLPQAVKLWRHWLALQWQRQ